MRQDADCRWLQPVLEQAALGVLVECGGSVRYINRAYGELLGYSWPERLIGRPVADLVAADDVERLLRFGSLRAEGKKAPSSYDFSARRKDGTHLRLHAAVSVATVNGQPFILTFARAFYPAVAPTRSPLAEQGPHLLLSVREQEVMRRILDGDRIKEIALGLKVSEKTVATHRSRLLCKMGFSDNRALFQYAVRHRLVDWS